MTIKKNQKIGMRPDGTPIYSQDILTGADLTNADLTNAKGMK